METTVMRFGAEGLGRVWMIALSLAALPVAAQTPAPAVKAAKPGELPADVAAVFEQHGLRIVGTGLALEAEAEAIKAVKDLARFKKSLMMADRERYAAEAELEAVKQRSSDLRTRHTLLSAQLANVSDPISNNRLVGELNTIKGLHDSLGEQQEKSADKVKTARGKANDIREEFVQALLAVRQGIDRVEREWESLAADKDVTAAVAAAAAATGRKLALRPAAGLVAAERQLETYEQSVISEAISLENDRGNFWVNVVVNGKPVERMVVDSGASSISLSAALARKLGIEPKSSDADITVGLADGRRIPAKLVRLASVRVGRFTAEDVECVVLGEEATEAPPLLGMSFLGQFKFELDAAQSQLRIVKVDSGEAPPAAKGPKRKPK